jgi:Galactose oxidase-like, Early set domain/PKD domain
MRARHTLPKALLVTTIVALWTQAPVGQVNVQGQWRTLTPLVPINPVHMALMHTGKVLIVAGSGNVASETNFRAVVWNPQTTGFTSVPSPGWDMFCNGMVALSDGRIFINGGNLKYDPFWGEPRNATYDPLTGLFTNLENMAHGRWYPTATVLGDGRVLSFSGLNETSATNKAVEIYTVGTGWSQEYVASWTPPLYPRMHLLPNGNVVYTGSGTGTRTFNTTNNTWSGVIATTRYSGTRTYGTSVLLPLTPANGYKPRVMIFGGGNPATATTEIIDPSSPTPQWQFGPSMSQPRIEMNATILPNGRVLATGGSTNDEDAATASKNADLYDPVTNTFSSAGANAFPRLYHSNSLLLPDATVLLAGGNPTRGSYEAHLEIYSPAYLFKSDGTPATRPTITGPLPASVGYGTTFDVQTPDAANIASVVLVRPGAPTHAFDMEQRLVGLSYTAGSGVLTVTAPPNGNIAPPGYYMLFMLNAAGVPSIASFVQLAPTSSSNEPPTATITNPGSSMTINAGQSVFFSGTGTDTDGSIASYSWAFPGGNPSSSSADNPGNVTYSAAGNYVASFTVTDIQGASSPAATRSISVSDFSISASPASQTVLPGGSATYTVTATPVNGFSGTISFSVTGLPTGATASFNPGSIASSGSSTLTIATSRMLKN